MDERIKDAELYLAARLAECEGRPDLHRNTAQVYRNYLAVVRERPNDYVREAGDMFAVMKAEQLDRNENFAALHRKFRNFESVLAYEERAKAVGESTGYGDFYTKNGEAQKRTKGLLDIEFEKRDLLMSLMKSIVAWRVGIPADRASAKPQARAAWGRLAQIDSDFSWERIRSHPPYRNCLYYNNEQLGLLERWFKEMGS